MTRYAPGELNTGHTGRGTLSALMDFHHVVRVFPDGTVSDDRADVAGADAPELYQWESPEGVWEEEMMSGTWRLVSGFSGQHGYRGPMMHASEQLAGGIARHVLATPGLWVALYPSCTDAAGEDVEADSWALAWRAVAS